MFIRYINRGHIIWLRSTPSYAQVIRNYSPHSEGTAGLWYDPVLTDQLPGLAWSQMTGAHNLFRLYALVIYNHCPSPAQGNVEDLGYVSGVPHSNHHSVGTASWQNHDSSPLQSVIVLYCHVCLYLSNTYVSFALWRQCKRKITAHLPGYPRHAQGLE